MQSTIPACPSHATTQPFVRAEEDRSDFCARVASASQPTPERMVDVGGAYDGCLESVASNPQYHPQGKFPLEP